MAVATLDLGCRLVETKKASEMIDQSKRVVAVARHEAASVGPAPATRSTASQPANQARHPAERWRGKTVDDRKQAA